MFTPQQIEQISFGKATFGGYNMEDVDQFLEPLTEDYITLYKENALLKSKMKVLVAKLEEYRNNEASMKDAIINAQKTCDKMVRDAEVKCAKMLSDANATAAENAKNADAMIAIETARVEEAKKVATARIEELVQDMHSCINALERIKRANAPAPEAAVENIAFDYDRSEHSASSKDADAVAIEIAANLEALVGTIEETEPPKAEPMHPASETTSKFANLRFGPNYDPTNR